MMGHYTIRARRISPYRGLANKACHRRWGWVSVTLRAVRFCVLLSIVKTTTVTGRRELRTADFNKPYPAGTGMPL